MTKRERERAILKMVYDVHAYASIDDHERPDFLLRHSVDGPPFGIEVTELFATESDARMRHRADYITRLFAGGAPMHKDDVKTLRVAKVVITTKDGVEKARDVPAIIRRMPTVAEHSRMIADTIRRKDVQAATYDPMHSHVNLVILDRVDSLVGSGEINTAEWFCKELKSALLETSFREVFWIRTIEHARRVFIPLRMLLLLSEFYLFGDAVVLYGPTPETLDPESLAELFVGFMQPRGLSVQLIRHGHDQRAAAFGNTAVLLDAEGRVSVLDFADFIVPSPIEASPDSLTGTEQFASHYRSHVSNNSFVTELMIDVVVDSAI